MSTALKENLICHGDDFMYVRWPDTSPRVSFEPKPEIEHTFTLDEFTRFHFSDEGYPPRDQMERNIRFLHTLLPDKFTYFLDTKSIYPLISERANASRGISSVVTPDALANARPSSLEYNLLMKASSHAKLCLFMEKNQDIVKVRTGLIESLNQAIKSGKAIRQKAGNTETKKWIYKLEDPSDAISVEPLGQPTKKISERQPYIIIEEGEEILGNPKLSIKIAVGTEDDHPTVQAFSPYQPLFEIEISSDKTTTTRDNILLTVGDRHFPRWIFRQDDPHPSADLSRSLLMWLRQPPMHYDVALQHSDLPHMVFHDPEQIRRTYPSYLLEMLMSASTLINHAVIYDPKEYKGGFPVFDEKSQEKFKKRAVFMAEEIQSKYTMEWKGKIPDIYTPYDYLLYQLIWEGKDIWPDLQQFTYTMIDSLQRNPEVFWQSFYELGLNNILPYFIRHKDESEYSIIQNLQKGGLKTLVEAFDLLPDLSPYYNFSNRRGARQKDAYYMQVLYALTYYALQNGDCGIASLVEKNGRILAARHNGKNGVLEHAEILALQDAAKYLPKTLDGKPDFTECTQGTTTLHCHPCAGFLKEEAPNLNRIFYAGESAMSARKLLGRTNLKHIDRANPIVPKHGVLEDKFRKLHELLSIYDLQYADMYN